MNNPFLSNLKYIDMDIYRKVVEESEKEREKKRRDYKMSKEWIEFRKKQLDDIKKRFSSVFIK